MDAEDRQSVRTTLHDMNNALHLIQLAMEAIRIRADDPTHVRDALDSMQEQGIDQLRKHVGSLRRHLGFEGAESR